MHSLKVNLTHAMITMLAVVASAAHGAGAVLPYAPVSQLGANTPANAPIAAPVANAQDATPKTSTPVKNKKVVKPHGLSPSSSSPSYLPGLGQFGTPSDNGASPLKQNVVRISGNNEIVYVSASMPNRIATPFVKPRVIALDGGEMDGETGKCGTFCVVGKDVYVTPTGDSPIGVFISDASQEGVVAMLTLIPKKIPGQNITLVSETQRRDAQAKDMPEVASDYMDSIRIVMKQLALKQIPSGFTEGPLKVGVAKVGQLMIVPDRMYSGASLDVFVYTVENTSSDVIEMNEQSFYQPGVRAVSFFPKVRLGAGETTRAYVMASRREE